MRLATVSDIKLFMDKQDNDHDSVIGLIVDAVSGAMEGYTNRWFEKKSRTEYFNSGGNFFQLRAFPIDSVIATVVMVDGYRMDEGTDYFVFHDRGSIEFTADTEAVEPKNVSITYTGGYAWTQGSGRLDVPMDLYYACILQTSYNFRNRRNVGLTSISMPDGSINTSSQEELLPQVMNTLDRYQL
jgi:hypothetical protein